MFSSTDESRERWRRESLRGNGGWGPPESFEILMLWNAISYVLRRQFCLKCSLNQLSVSCLFMFVFENNGAGYQFQLKYTLLLYKYHKNSYKISEMSKSGFFLSRSHIGRDSGFSSKIGRNSTWSGWLDSLITWYTIVPLICYFKMWTQCYFP